MSPRPASILLSTVFCCTLLASAPAAADIRYPVDTVPQRIINITRINNHGEVAGTAWLDRELYYLDYPFWSTPTGWKNLDYLTFYGTVTLNAINDTGGSAGIIQPTNSMSRYAYAQVSEDGPLQAIAPTGNMYSLTPTSISNERSAPYVYVAGDASMMSGDEQAFRWAMTGSASGAMVALGTLGGDTSHAADVNVAGMVTGWAQTASGARHAYVYRDDAMVDLGALAGGESAGMSLNEAGAVVGWSRMSADTTLGFVWQDGQIDYLDTLGGASSSAADINSRGWIVGNSTLADGSLHAFVYIDGEMIDLNTLINPATGIVIRDALSINDRGDILAYSPTAGYIILSVPEPGTWAMLLAGMVLLAAVRRRPGRVLYPSLLLGAMLCLPLAARAVELRYGVRPMPQPPGIVTSVGGINNAGVVVGTLSEWTGHISVDRGFHWSGNTAVAVDYPDAYNTRIAGINDHGAIVGDALAPAGMVGFLAGGPDEVGVSLGQLPGGTVTAPLGINNNMQVVGTANSGVSDTHAFLWHAGTMHDLGTLGGSDSRAEAINDNGMITGSARTANSQTHAFLYVDGVMHDLGALAGGYSAGVAINNAGTVVGQMWVEPGSTRGMAFMHRDGVTTFLGTMDGNGSYATDINELGWIVGTIQTPGARPYTYEYHGFVYIDGTMIDLNTLVDPAGGWSIRQALAINDSGQIVVEACRSSGACNYAVLTAVPEPGQWALLTAGMALLAARRRAGTR